MHKESAWRFEPNDDQFRPTLQEGHLSLATIADRVLIAGIAQSRELATRMLYEWHPFRFGLRLVGDEQIATT